MELEFSRQVFNKTTNTKFHLNPTNGSRVVSRGQTDGQKRRISQSLFAVLRKGLKLSVLTKAGRQTYKTY